MFCPQYVPVTMSAAPRPARVVNFSPPRPLPTAVDELAPDRGIDLSQRRQAARGWHGEQRRADNRLDGRELQRPHNAALRDSPHERDVRCAHHRGSEHQQVADPGSVEATAGHEHGNLPTATAAATLDPGPTHRT
jgi:hypothetical protein